MRSASLAQPLALFAKLVKKPTTTLSRATRGMLAPEIKAIPVIERQPTGGTERTIKQ